MVRTKPKVKEFLLNAPMNSALFLCPYLHPSVTPFSKDWLITFT